MSGFRQDKTRQAAKTKFDVPLQKFQEDSAKNSVCISIWAIICAVAVMDRLQRAVYKLTGKCWRCFNETQIKLQAGQKFWPRTGAPVIRWGVS